MANNTTFHAGQKVRRIGHSVDNVVKGEIYTVSRYMDGHVTLKGLGETLWYNAPFFELVDVHDMASVPMLVQGEGSVLMANIDKETGEVRQVIMAMPGIINLDAPEEMVGYCIYDFNGCYEVGFTEQYWDRNLFTVIDAATLTFKLP